MELSDICNLAVATIRVRPWSINETIGSVLSSCDEATFNGMLTKADLIDTLKKVLTEEIVEHSGYENDQYTLFDWALCAKGLEMSGEKTINVPYHGRFVGLNIRRLIDYIRFKLCR